LLTFGFLLAGCRVTVQFDSEPQGALVSMGASRIGTTPCSTSLTSQDHDRQFEFALEGHEPKTVNRKVYASFFERAFGSPVIHVTALFEAKVTKVRINVRPRGARIRAFYPDPETGNRVEFDWGNQAGARSGLPSVRDDRFWGERDSVPVTIEISADQYRTLVAEREIVRGESLDLEYVLKPLSVDFVLEVEELEGVDVYERTLGYLGRTPLKHRILSADLGRISTHIDQSKLTEAKLNLVLKKQGYKDLELTRSVKIGDEVNVIKTRMEKQ
jgi:hypothetical protein